MKTIILVFVVMIVLLILPVESFAATGGFAIEADKSHYTYGDIVTILGSIYPEYLTNSPVTLTITNRITGEFVKSDTIFFDSNAKFQYVIDTNRPPWKHSISYLVLASYPSGGQDPTDFILEPTEEQIKLMDRVEPLVIVPKNIMIDSSVPTAVTFSVKAIDDRDGVLAVTCTPPSGSVFPVGRTEVFCKALDSTTNQGNGYFLVIVKDMSLSIPDWIKDVAAFWVNDEIDNDGFVQVIQYLVENDVIIIPNADSSSEQTTQIPSWIKTNAEFWVNDQISDQEFATGIEWLINNGIISV